MFDVLQMQCLDKFNTQMDDSRKNYVLCCARELGAGLTISPGLHICVYSAVREYLYKDTNRLDDLESLGDRK